MTILEIKGLNVDFNGFKAITNLDFSLDEGETRTIIGPNGAGKTTFTDLITGETKPTSGSIHFKGIKINGLNPSKTSKIGIGRKFQGPNIFNNLTVEENIEVAFQNATNVFKSLIFRKSDVLKKRIEDVLINIGLMHRKDTIAEILSHGEKQWLEMGMILVQEPELIILDEPTTGMTAEETYKTGELIKKIFKKQTVIVIEHDMNFVRQIAEKITVLHQGQVLAEGSIKEIESNEEVQRVYLRNE